METQGIQYSGSKKNMIGRILGSIPLDCHSILDGCSGTTRVSQAFKQAGYSVWSNDISEYSYVFGLCYIKNNNFDFSDLIRHLNSVPAKHGWLTNNYGGEDNFGSSINNGFKKNWLIKNAMKADGIRDEIEKLQLNSIDKSVAITSLILSLDKTSNNLGHHVSFLSKWASRCFKDLILEVPKLICQNKHYEVLKQDISSITNRFDLVYLDLPYGSNNKKMPSSRVRYNSYYNIWTSVVKWDDPEVFGKSKRRADSKDSHVGAISDYEIVDYEVVLDKILSTCKNLNCKYILFSYNNKAIVPIDVLIDNLKQIGSLSIKDYDFKENVQKNTVSTQEWLGDKSQNKEYLILITK